MFFSEIILRRQKAYTFIARRGRIQKGILSIIISYSNYKF